MSDRDTERIMHELYDKLLTLNMSIAVFRITEQVPLGGESPDARTSGGLVNDTTLCWLHRRLVQLGMHRCLLYVA